MPATPRWLLAVPDAIRQLETLDRDLLTRRDVERLFGVSRARAAQLMRTFGAARVGASRVLRRTALLRQLRTYRQRAAFRGEEERRTRLVAALRQARLTGIRVAVPRAARAARLAGLPDGVSVEPGRIEVRFRGAPDAVGRLFALAQALTHDYEQFEALVDGATRRARRGSGEGMSDDVVRVAPPDARRPARAASTARLVVPRLIVDAGPVAVARVLEFFAARIANRRTRAAYGRAVGQFLAWCAAWGSRRSRRCTWRPTSGPTPGRRPPSSSTWRPSACSAADGPDALTASRPGDDQAAGGDRGSPALDLLPHVPGDGDHGVSVAWGDARTRAADRRVRLPRRPRSSTTGRRTQSPPTRSSAS